MTVDISMISELDQAGIFIPQVRNKTERIIIHHSAGSSDGTREHIDEQHKKQGFGMIGYHYVIEKDGTTQIGRPDWAVGAHALGANYDSIGICLPGNFQGTLPTEAQIKSLAALIKRIRNLYGAIPYQGHNAVDPVNHPTACPGKMFPWAELERRLKENILSEIKVFIKDKEITGKLIDNRTYVPVVELIKLLNNEVIWDENDRSVTIK